MGDDDCPVLDVRGLTRSYGRFRPVHAVQGVSFQVHRGEIFGLVGPDGAGKTTIIQTLAGVLAPGTGSVSVAGCDAQRDGERVRRLVGYMPQGLGSNLYDSLTVTENIEFFRDLRGLSREVYLRNRTALLTATRLAPFLDRRASTLSGGMRQKLALICTLIHLPDVLLLDEPTTGVDPISRQEFWQIIGRVVDQRRATVLVSTSYMDEAARCHRVALVHAGRIVAEGSPDRIRERATGRYAHLTASPQPVALRLLRGRTDVVSTEVFGDEIHLQFAGDLRTIEGALREHDVTVDHLSIEEPTLEDVFLQLAEGASQPTAPPALVFPQTIGGSTGAIDCRSVTRRFGNFVAVDDVNLSVRRGEIFGLLGPNGAGKTTLIKMLCGLLRPSAGDVLVGGMNVGREPAGTWRAIGYMSQRFSLYQDLTVQQNVRLYADLYDLTRHEYDPLMQSLGLDRLAHRLTRDLPAGVRQRLSLLCAVLHHPDIVFLDEPTSGVDPQARRVFWDLIYSLSRETGVTALVSTHYMDEATHCDRLGLMHQGRLIAVGSPSEIKQQSESASGNVLAIHAPDPARAFAVVSRERPNAGVYGADIRIRSRAPDADLVAMTSLLAREGIGPVRIERAPISMDEAFIDFIERSEAVRA